MTELDSRDKNQDNSIYNSWFLVLDSWLSLHGHLLRQAY